MVGLAPTGGHAVGAGAVRVDGRDAVTPPGQGPDAANETAASGRREDEVPTSAPPAAGQGLRLVDVTDEGHAVLPVRPVDGRACADEPLGVLAVGPPVDGRGRPDLALVEGLQGEVAVRHVVDRVVDPGLASPRRVDGRPARVFLLASRLPSLGGPAYCFLREDTSRPLAKTNVVEEIVYSQYGRHVECRQPLLFWRPFP